MRWALKVRSEEESIHDFALDSWLNLELGDGGNIHWDVEERRRIGRKYDGLIYMHQFKCSMGHLKKKSSSSTIMHAESNRHTYAGDKEFTVARELRLVQKT